MRRKEAQGLESIAESASSDDESRARGAFATGGSAAPRGLYITDSSDGSGCWLDLSGLGDDEMLSVADLRARLAVAQGVEQE